MPKGKGGQRWVGECRAREPSHPRLLKHEEPRVHPELGGRRAEGAAGSVKRAYLGRSTVSAASVKHEWRL